MVSLVELIECKKKRAKKTKLGGDAPTSLVSIFFSFLLPPSSSTSVFVVDASVFVPRFQVTRGLFRLQEQPRRTKLEFLTPPLRATRVAGE